MANPYQSPKTVRPSAQPVPKKWHELFLQLYWPVWWIGTALIVGSWFNVVPAMFGWVGFGLASAATLGSYSVSSLVGDPSRDCVVLDSRLINTKGAAYLNALERFTNGATLMYDGIAFAFRPDNEIACGIVAESPNVSESEALEIANHAQEVFDTLKSASPEFSAAVTGLTFRISIMSNMDANAVEIFRFIDGKIESRP